MYSKTPHDNEKKQEGCSVQGRVARAIPVNGLPSSRIDALKMDGIITLGSFGPGNKRF